KIFQEKVPLVGGKPHAGTVLAVAARLAGSSLYRSLNYKKDIAPGIVVLSNEVNEAWPQLMNLFAFYCKQNGMDVMSKPLVTKFSEQDKPRMEVEQVLAEYQDQYHAIMQRHGLDYLNGARAGMVVCSIIFQYHYKVAKDIDPYVATGIIAMGVVEGAKTTPPPLKPVNSTKPVSPNHGQNNQLTGVLRSIAENSTNGSGTRLVLGEGMTSMQEALSNGGKYILVHPEVVNQLKQNNIDPFFVYEAAMRIEMESKIPRIDFVGTNVDKLLQEWSGKPEVQIPVHVRQILWLKNNAKTYGYDQSGSSWILKP
ncbi:MAG TPA: hypothetical protein VK206_18000, partial [Anaerolineales bacterium]|nr:hypothetical protein [Anaerolineales bacterium]